MDVFLALLPWALLAGVMGVAEWKREARRIERMTAATMLRRANDARIAAEQIALNMRKENEVLRETIKKGRYS